nr:hypothetical protein [Vibrio parahaemolyticus]
MAQLRTTLRRFVRGAKYCWRSKATELFECACKSAT